MDKFEPFHNPDSVKRKVSADTVVSPGVLSMYKVAGSKEPTYEHYLKSVRLFGEAISNAEKNERNENSTLRVKKEILNSPKDTIATSVLSALESNNIEIQRIGASLMYKVPEDKLEYFDSVLCDKIIARLENEDIQIQRIAMNMLPFVSPKRRAELRKIIYNKIIDIFNSTNVHNWRIAAKKVELVPESEQENVREIVYQKTIEILNHDDIESHRLASLMVRYAPKLKQKELKSLVMSKFELAKQAGKFNEITKPSIYLKDSGTESSSFSHRNFSKTGSDTTLLLGEQFKNNLIIRHIEGSCFGAWREAYESFDEWKKAGFDYVPIEPIYSFNYDARKDLVNVASGVLDINLEEWYTFSDGAFKEGLDAVKSKVFEVLSVLGINHGHPNDANFCLRFERDVNGIPDITKVPRVYLIDFDKAIKL